MAPESDPVVRLLAGSYWNKLDMKMVLRKTLKASCIPLCDVKFVYVTIFYKTFV